PARDLVFHQRGEGLLTAPGLVRNFAAEVEQALMGIFVIERLVERVAELVEDRLWRPLGRKLRRSRLTPGIAEARPPPRSARPGAPNCAWSFQLHRALNAPP